MNTSRPVASSIEGVNFSIIAPEDVMSVSVRRITSPNTFDSLLNPIPGGLYDSALGAALNNPCSTCHLDEQSCPGHCGHIELPVYVYHCVFMDQVYRLLRAQCIYCQRLKMSRVEVNRFCCKLKLISHGLLKEAKEMDDLDRLKFESVHLSATRLDSNPESSDEAGDDEVTNIIAKRLQFVKSCLRSLRRADKGGFGTSLQENETVMAARKLAILEFKTDMLKTRQCQNCKGISPGYRKNRFSGIFKKPLSEKDRAKNAQFEISAPQNPLDALNKAAEVERRRVARKKQQDHKNDQIDEGVADLDTASNEEDDVLNMPGFETELPSSEYDEDAESIDEHSSSAYHAQSETAKVRSKPKEKEVVEGETYISASEVHASLVALFSREPEIMSLVYQSSSVGGEIRPPTADMFFVRCLLVPPSKFRKESKTGPDTISEPPDHSTYKRILTTSDEIWQIQKEIKGEATKQRAQLRNYDDLQRSCVELQDCVNTLFDSAKTSVRGYAALKIPEGIKQRLERKEGLFRMFIMGKRVNFAARTVISPDPNIETNEIGIPPVFARTLTYPEPVTSHSFDELKQAVKNGPNKWPGAIAVEYENGQVISLRNKSDEDRLSIANLLLAPSNSSATGVKNKRVHRHLNNGDIVIMNRQPTLHKPSMMCHRAKVLPHEKTLRMHYANCNTYNADFDGDEMNLHFPQNEIARAEALQIADTDHQYLSATAGKPLRGLIQDHISMSVWLTCNDMFFNRQEYQQLLYSCLRPESNHVMSNRIVLVDPTIIKPRPTWTGKQVITTILANIRPKSHGLLNMESPSSTPGDRWNDISDEGTVRIQDGELLTGILDKKQIGPTSGGLNHMVYEAYGHTIAGKLIGILGRLLTRMLNMRAFSCGVEDLLLTQQGEIARKNQLMGASAIGLTTASAYVSMDRPGLQDDDPELLNRLESLVRDDAKQAGLDVLMNSSTSKLTSAITKECLPEGLIKPFPRNQMQTMTTSGAKGSMVNANQITCNLGQQVLEGRRVPIMVSGKTLPSFNPFESSVRAGGYVVDRFLTGVKPQEFYFHAMAGREGLIDTAVKTARSGYLQRCLVKGLEGARAGYDTTVRDADGSIIQSLYGEDGLEIIKQQALTDFRFLSKNFLSLYASLNCREDQSRTESHEAIAWNEKSIKASRNGDLTAMDPVLSRYPPAVFAGSVSEKFYTAAKRYIKDNPDKTIRSKTVKLANSVARRTFEEAMRLNYLRAVVPPGEAVGVVAAQSIGEPSTQMTLNTFHLAGHAAKNVTLGIPRLREILMTASRNIKTPTMSMYPIPEMTKDDCDRFAKSISRLSLAEIIDSVHVEERIDQGISPDARIYVVRLGFYPAAEYTDEYAITISDVAQKLEISFLPRLQKLIKVELKRRGQNVLKSASRIDAQPTIGESAGRVKEVVPRLEVQNNGGDSDEDYDGDDDAETTKRKSNLDEGMTYEDPDDDEQEIVMQGEKEADDTAESEPEDEGYGGSEHSSSSDSESDADSSKKLLKERAKDREARIKQAISRLTSFSFDETHGQSCKMTFEYAAADPKILLLDLLNRAAHATLIQEVEGIRSCTSTVDQNKAPLILAEGVNLVAMQNYQDIINPHRTYTNDIHAVLVRYGVEAARNLIIKELGGVFEGHGISVDHRHLTLVADYMTRDGGYKPFSRTGMRDKRSPFAKMSFETTMGFLSDAVLDGETEELASPSARITVGKVGTMGTGMCDVFMPCN